MTLQRPSPQAQKYEISPFKSKKDFLLIANALWLTKIGKISIKNIFQKKTRKINDKKPVKKTFLLLFFKERQITKINKNQFLCWNKWERFIHRKSRRERNEKPTTKQRLSIMCALYVRGKAILFLRLDLWAFQDEVCVPECYKKMSILWSHLEVPFEWNLTIWEA